MGKYVFPVLIIIHEVTNKASLVSFLIQGRGGAYHRLEHYVTQIVEERLGRYNGPAGKWEEPVSMSSPTRRTWTQRP